mgnify:CR=1 FL=1|jgi:hypothetical protein
MNLESHVFVSKVVHDQISKVFPVVVSRKLFRAGNVLSDYSLLVWTKPHYYLVSWEFIEEYIDNVCSLKTDEDASDPDLLLSFQLGIICHYITDFFCRAHIGTGIGPKREHLQYEDFLDNYRYSMQDQLENYDWLEGVEADVSPRMVKENLKRNIELYRQSPASPERDITMAIANCVQVMLSIIAIRLRQTATRDIFSIMHSPVLSINWPDVTMTELYQMVMEKKYSKVLAYIQP